jgi:hypothetical protein
VRYVDFGGDNLNFVEALQLIRDAPEHPTSLATPAGTFDRFTYELAFLANGQQPPAPGSNGDIEVPPIPAELMLGEGTVEQIFAGFRDALATATEAKPMVLILDHVGRVVAPDFKQRLYPLLIEKVVQERDPPNVQLVLVMSTEQRRDHWPADVGDAGMEIEVQTIAPDHWEPLAEDFVLAMGKEMVPRHEQLIAALKDYINANWKPTQFKDLDVVRRN